MSEQHAVALRPKQVTEADIEPLSAAEIVLLQGDLSILTAKQRVDYYGRVCESVGLNPLTKPFDYIVLNGKLTLYAKKDATDQLRRIYDISVTKLEREQTPDSYDVTAYGTDMRTGRTDSSLGSVPIANLRGEALANAKMKAETKAKRRLTLSMAGLGWLDETELATIPSAQPVVVTEEGEIVPDKPKTLADALATPAPYDTPPDPARPTSTAPEPDGQEDTTETLPEDTTAPAPPAEDVPAMMLTLDDFNAWRREKFIQPAVIAKTATALFGGKSEGHNSLSDLTGEQLAYLQSVLAEQLEHDRIRPA